MLSRGAAGSLQLATDTRKNTYVVIKLLERGPGVTKNLERELLAHRRYIFVHNLSPDAPAT